MVMVCPLKTSAKLEFRKPFRFWAVPCIFLSIKRSTLVIKVRPSTTIWSFCTSLLWLKIRSVLIPSSIPNLVVNNSLSLSPSVRLLSGMDRDDKATSHSPSEVRGGNGLLVRNSLIGSLINTTRVMVTTKQQSAMAGRITRKVDQLTVGLGQNDFYDSDGRTP